MKNRATIVNDVQAAVMNSRPIFACLTSFSGLINTTIKISTLTPNFFETGDQVVLSQIKSNIDGVHSITIIDAHSFYLNTTIPADPDNYNLTGICQNLACKISTFKNIYFQDVINTPSIVYPLFILDDYYFKSTGQFYNTEYEEYTLGFQLCYVIGTNVEKEIEAYLDAEMLNILGVLTGKGTSNTGIYYRLSDGRIDKLFTYGVYLQKCTVLQITFKCFINICNDITAVSGSYGGILIGGQATNEPLFTAWLAQGGGGGATIASQAEAEAGEDNTKIMSPLRSLQQFVYQVASKAFSDLNTAHKTLIGAINDLVTAIGNIVVPTNTSQLNNDNGFITSKDIPTKLSQFSNDEGFINEDVLDRRIVDLITIVDDGHIPSGEAGMKYYNSSQNMIFTYTMDGWEFPEEPQMATIYYNLTDGIYYHYYETGGIQLLMPSLTPSTQYMTDYADKRFCTDAEKSAIGTIGQKAGDGFVFHYATSAEIACLTDKPGANLKDADILLGENSETNPAWNKIRISLSSFKTYMIGKLLNIMGEESSTPCVDDSDSTGANGTKYFVFITLPATYKFYMITGIEWKNGTAVAGNITSGVVSVEANPAAGLPNVHICVFQTAAQTGANTVQRNSIASSNLIPGGAIIGAYIQPSSTGAHLRYLANQSNIVRAKVVAYSANHSYVESNSWDTSTSLFYIKIYYKGVN